ncbi:glycosyltransferase 87 family protein [Aureivirga marina]|uniref:glycosyltransferase 87 family protein n=1 Tax=Aureivirga marina TaxID=1182451 RepID=UPI0018C8E39A|nr:glycosyltransferase 87 family protein [Aureivirga marina]
MKNILKLNNPSIFAILFSLIAYISLAYFTVREDFPQVIGLYSVAFLGFLVLMKQKLDFKTLVLLAIIFRLVFLPVIPNLSNDFYRFIWDGRMIYNGWNPYLILPENNPDLIVEGSQLYAGMGSMNGSHFTCYPPVNQFAFFIPSIFFSENLLGSTIVMRILIILADLGTLYFGKKLLEHFNLSPKSIFLYILNPFLIIEMTGNLHFEGVMLFLLVWSLYLLFKNKWQLSAVVFALSVSVKLIPLLFLPLFFRKLKFKKSFFFYCIVGLTSVVLFLPFVSTELYDNFMKSIHLYFQNFEFNASIYYIIREIGYHQVGYNIIQTVGKITPFIILTIVLLLTFIRKNEKHIILFQSMVIAVCSYYFIGSVIHPWYIAVPLVLSVFTNYKFPLVWSFLIMLSYIAYSNNVYQENYWLIGFEYTIVYGLFIYEVILNKKITWFSFEEGNSKLSIK